MGNTLRSIASMEGAHHVRGDRALAIIVHPVTPSMTGPATDTESPR